MDLAVAAKRANQGGETGRRPPLRLNASSAEVTFGVGGNGDPFLDEALPGPRDVLLAGPFDLLWPVSIGPEVAFSAKSNNSFESATLTIATRGLGRGMVASAPGPRFPGKSGFVVGVVAVVPTEVVEPLAGASGAPGSSNGGAWSSGWVVAPLPAKIPLVLPFPPDPV